MSRRATRRCGSDVARTKVEGSDAPSISHLYLHKRPHRRSADEAQVMWAEGMGNISMTEAGTKGAW